MARNTKEKAQETRERILDAAEDVFFDKGVSNTSLNDVAQAAGVTRGAIYWHFKNKADLFNAMCERVRTPIREKIEAIADEKTTDPLGQMRTSSLGIRQQIIDNPHYRKVLTILFHRCEYLDANDPILQYQRDWLLHGREATQRALAHAQVKGQLPAELDIRMASIVMHVAYDGMINTWLLTPDHFDLIKDGTRLLDAQLDSMRTSPALRQTVG
ncbi:MAG: TetR family transcriptional regulator [Burkholderiaceae bacterium]|nr:TetR family transcriptional regulator [Burkholderiaceae bacterium]